MIQTDVLVIGGGPSGLCAAQLLIESGFKVILVDRSPVLGGQLVKQTHKFFGSKEQHAKTRGFDIANLLIDPLLNHPDLEIWTGATVLGLYPDLVATINQNEQYHKIQAQAIVVASGASEKFLAFENNDLPGVYGAGAVQTLMNQYGVRPADKIVMVGSGNIGLIVSYQCLQAGIQVQAIVEAAPQIGGYKVHASKLARLGVPIYTQKTVKKAIGKDKVEACEIVSLDDQFKEIPGTSEVIETDGICISVGLSPSYQLLDMIDAKLGYVPELGGTIPLIDDNYMTSVNHVFACGDGVGIEEASAAMMEGYLTGLAVARHLNQPHPENEQLMKQYTNALNTLREGPFGYKTNVGIEKMKELIRRA
ncbi:MAG: NAD(P)/FAD-dependent oxidoreductase [Acholeplasmataceae bacterium]|nr:NAD(P)/FAD-dependent oxidoreductase [Acholeplasmataceae bacterium]